MLRRRERRREVDLERRALNHMEAMVCGGVQRQDRGADIAAHLHVVARLAQDVRNESRGRRLAVRACDGDERRIRRDLRPLAAEQFDVADDLDGDGLGEPHGPVRLGVGQRDAGREDERGEARPIRMP
jgi:hypothetical protein